MAIKCSMEKQTYHAGVERAERMARLEECLGFTNIVVERVCVRNGRAVREGITSSGILVVRSLNSDAIVTAFMVRIEKAYAVCRDAGKKQIPPKLEAKIRKNAIRFPELFNI